MPGTDEPKRDLRETDPDVLARALEMELFLKRAAWRKTAECRGTWRALSILFLLLVILPPRLRERGGETRSAERSR
ncbi:MAG: hypothetical protein H0X34_06795 [Chthoniobacterales bacterium]|nr:hypothetical protein [Chthoniobacterales bacterium]